MAPGKYGPRVQSQENLPIRVNHGLDSFYVRRVQRAHVYLSAAVRARDDFKEETDSLRASENITNVYPIQLSLRCGGLCLVVKSSHRLI